MFVELGIMQFLSHSIIPCSLFVLKRMLGSDGSRSGALKVRAGPVPAVRQALPHGATDRGFTVPALCRDANTTAWGHDGCVRGYPGCRLHQHRVDRKTVV